mgnify:CR=1 FL=1
MQYDTYFFYLLILNNRTLLITTVIEKIFLRSSHDLKKKKHTNNNDNGVPVSTERVVVILDDIDLITKNITENIDLKTENIFELPRTLELKTCGVIKTKRSKKKRSTHGKPSSIMQMIHDGFAVSAVFGLVDRFVILKIVTWE